MYQKTGESHPGATLHLREQGPATAATLSHNLRESQMAATLPYATVEKHLSATQMKKVQYLYGYPRHPLKGDSHFVLNIDTCTNDVI